MSIIRFEDVDVIFTKDPREALKLLDQGMTRNEILKKTGQIVGVEKASLDIEKGEICVLMGLSGSGKSSLLRCINGLNTVSRGKLFVEHEGRQIDIASCSAAELKMMRTKRIAMVFQKFALMPWLTVRENISFGLEMQGRPEKDRRKLVDEKLELVGLTQWRNKKPDELSGGMQQRVGLARALANDPTILLMDEAFSALDPLIRSEMQGELIRLQAEQQRTIIFISHDIEEAIRIGHRIAIMEGGRVVQIGTPQELINQPANEYVRTFFKGFDSSRVLKAGDVAQLDPQTVCRVNGKAPQFKACTAFGYLIDDKGRLLGVVDTDESGASASDRYCQHEQQPVYVDTPLHEVLDIAATLPYPVPVLGRDGSFKGTVSKNQLLQPLSRH